jgi:hypothetical protein
MRLDALRRHPLVSHFGVAYAITGGGIGAVIALRPLRETSAADDFRLVFAAMALGPSLAGIVMTLVLEGRAGISGLRKRHFHWRVGMRWYLVALGTTPMILLSIL